MKEKKFDPFLSRFRLLSGLNLVVGCLKDDAPKRKILTGKKSTFSEDGGLFGKVILRNFKIRDNNVPFRSLILLQKL
jgi:hypothetical protein